MIEVYGLKRRKKPQRDYFKIMTKKRDLKRKVYLIVEGVMAEKENTIDFTFFLKERKVKITW